MSHDQQMDRHIHTVHGGLEQHEPDQQLNPAFQLQSLFKHAARLRGAAHSGCEEICPTLFPPIKKKKKKVLMSEKTEST